MGEYKISLSQLMILERLLLEMEVRVKFDLPFGDAFKLYDYLLEVGRITNYAFKIQDDFNTKFNDKEKLKEYHEKVMDSEVEYDYWKVIDFIDKVVESNVSEDYNKVVNTFMFWGKTEE